MRQVHAGVHSVRGVQIPPEHRLPRNVLDADGPAYLTAVFAEERAIRLFVSTVTDDHAAEVLSEYVVTSEMETVKREHVWRSRGVPAQFRVFAGSEGEYYVVWCDPQNAETGNLQLYWSCSRTPAKAHQLTTESRQHYHVKAAPVGAVGIEHGKAYGLLLWQALSADFISRTWIADLSGGKWSLPSILPLDGSVRAVALKGRQGAILAVKHDQLLAFPFTVPKRGS